MAKRIAIQGYEGSFHQMATQSFFGKDTEVICCATFREVVKIATDASLSDGGIMAIENSIAGSILPNYNLLQNAKLQVIGEIYLQIRQHLLVNEGISLSDIKEVHSHPMALLQCTDFLDEQKWKLVETEDTALSAKYVARHHSKHIAAVAGSFAAEMYGLKILKPDIQTEKDNYTRFLAIVPAKTAEVPITATKASVYFQTDHKQGSLAKVLTKIADAGINLSKLQSCPVPGSPWEYGFHADMEFDSILPFQSVIDQLRHLTHSLKVYGIYKKGKTVK
ncbi:MAG: chorismate mutase [Chitinophagaceae bacterium]|nr:chorismate mutase [Chitinophagaceae bacterium]